MVFQVCCFKCNEFKVRLVLGGREIIHARCQACNANLLAEVLEFEQEVLQNRPRRKRSATQPTILTAEQAETLSKR